MFKTLLPLCATAILLTACSSDGTDVDDTTDMVEESGESEDIDADDSTDTESDTDIVTQFGSIFVSESLQDNTVIAGGDFFDISATPRSAADVLTDPPITSDSCTGSASTQIETPETPENEPFPISAGETITLSSQGNTYTTLLRQGSEFVFYSSENSLSSPAPAALTVDIPGDEFPSFTNISIPDVPALEINSPAIGEPITPLTEFSWAGNNDQNTFASISLRYTDTETGEVVFVSCQVVDDGNFTFPADIQEMINADSTPDFASFTRASRGALVSGDAALSVTNIITVDF